MNFLASMLRDEGGFEYKKAIVDTIITIIEDNQAAKDLGLSHLCEFIEDCEHSALATRVLHLLGREGPTTINPSRYIRFIYNRVILETNQVIGVLFFMVTNVQNTGDMWLCIMLDKKLQESNF
jgi:coatomer protein complex subunit gamma